MPGFQPPLQLDGKLVQYSIYSKSYSALQYVALSLIATGVVLSIVAELIELHYNWFKSTAYVYSAYEHAKHYI